MSSSIFVKTLSQEQQALIHQYMIKEGFQFQEAPHTLFVAKKNSISVALYKSGKLVVQGKGISEFVEYGIEPLLGSFSHRYGADIESIFSHIGSDEAGKGDLFGPLCVAAFFGEERVLFGLAEKGIKDSKKLSDKQVLQLSKILEQYPHEVLVLSPKKYNELYQKFQNLNHLLAWAHAKVIGTLCSKTNCDKVVVDQFATNSRISYFLNNPKIQIEEKIRAESDLSVAAASILARAAFLQSLDHLSQEVGLTLPKGAGAITLEVSKQIIDKYGIEALKSCTKHHFKSNLIH